MKVLILLLTIVFTAVNCSQLSDSWSCNFDDKSFCELEVDDKDSFRFMIGTDFSYVMFSRAMGITGTMVSPMAKLGFPMCIRFRYMTNNLQPVSLTLNMMDIMAGSEEKVWSTEVTFGRHYVWKSVAAEIRSYGMKYFRFQFKTSSKTDIIGLASLETSEITDESPCVLEE
ncbi:hypothetical protein HDE_11041 [Halotydeus destructor]|nr:hypothetical protein HDE_11041 [Halotydeus destructor]